MYEGESIVSPTTIVSGLGLGKPAPSSEYSSNIIVKNFPLLGRLHFVKDKNGILCLAFTFSYWVYGTWCGLWVVLLPHLRDGQASEPFVACKFGFLYHLSFYITWVTWGIRFRKGCCTFREWPLKPMVCWIISSC